MYNIVGFATHLYMLYMYIMKKVIKKYAQKHAEVNYLLYTHTYTIQ